MLKEEDFTTRNIFKTKIKHGLQTQCEKETM